ncbi:MAG: DUF4340 domain-containing protein [Candidatus Desulfofervidus auxilii]|nr:DUF4340 domain-containing protein [Candidatus Desulfofervidus auxilii]
MSWRKLALYAFFLLMMIIFYQYQKARLAKIKERQEKEKQICKLKTEDVFSIKLKNKYGNFEIKKENERWRLKQPVDDWADKFTIQGILDTITKAKAERTITPVPDKLLPYGLDKPRIEINLMAKKASFNLFLGSDTPDATKVYALTSKKKAIYLLPSSLVFSLNKDLDDLRDKRILDFDPIKVIKVNIKTSEKNILLEKENNQWYLKMPFKAKADKDEVEDVLYRLQTERAKGFEEKIKIKSELEIEISEKEKNHWLKLFKEKDKILAKSSYRPVVMILRKELWDELTKTPETFKDRHFIKFDQEKVKKVEIVYAGKKLKAIKKENKWAIEPKKMAEDYEIDFLISDLLNLKYLPKKIEKPKEFPLSKAEVKLWDNKKIILSLKCFEDKACIWVEYKDKFYAVDKKFLESFPHKMREG